MKVSYRILIAKQCWPSLATALCLVLAGLPGSNLLAQSSSPADDQRALNHQPLTAGESKAVDITPTDNQRLFELRVQSIQQRIEVLKYELSRRQSEEQRQANESPDTESDPHVIPTELSNSPSDGESDSHSPRQTDGHEGENKLAGTSGFQLVSMPANSMELGNSLFSTGNYSQALRSYESLLQDEKDPVDRAWIKCFAANCYRLQGNVSAAEKLYREVAGARMNVYAADQAQW
ncbi:MAG: tetratricopeptide repeat protein, partial [Pirellulaceae bacterium]